METTTKRRGAIVVGGSSGIGCETCARLANLGWAVTNISRTPCKNSKVENIACDVAAGTSVFNAVDSAAEKQSVDALIYCAGFSMAAPIEHAAESDVKYLFDVNYFGALKSVQAVIPYMKGKGGRIILVGSIGGDIPISFDSFYSSSKAALEMLCRSAYCELKPYGIKVTGVLPGGTATGFTFKRKVYSDSENGAYSGRVNKAVAALANMEQGGALPSEVADTICSLLFSQKVPVIKTCGAKNTMFRLASRIMPEKVTLKLNDRMYNQ